MSIYNILSVYSSVSGLLSCLHLLSVVNDAVMNMDILTSQHPIFPFICSSPLTGNPHSIQQPQRLDFLRQYRFHTIFSIVPQSHRKVPKIPVNFLLLCLKPRRDTEVVSKILIFLTQEVSLLLKSTPPPPPTPAH